MAGPVMPESGPVAVVCRGAFLVLLEAATVTSIAETVIRTIARTIRSAEACIGLLFVFMFWAFAILFRKIPDEVPENFSEKRFLTTDHADDTDVEHCFQTRIAQMATNLITLTQWTWGN